MEEKIIGAFLAHEKGFGFVKPENPEIEKDIFIAEKNINGALNEDVVEVEIIKDGDSKRSKEGKISKIVRRGKDTLVGTFQKSKNFGFVVPDDKRFGSDIFISKKYFGKARNNHKVVVKITKYPEKGRKAEGEIIEVIGNINQAGVDMLSIIKEYKLPARFPEDVVEEAKSYGDKIDTKDFKNRVDLRDRTVFTIDGEDAKDLDDAIMIERTADGERYILDVHIADVSHYVKDRSKLDREARIRGTSVYMLGRVIPMLPRELSNGLCSLNAGEDRYTLSVQMEIDKNGNVVASDVYKGIINVTERMTYTNVQKIIDGSDSEVLKRYEKYISDFKLMEELALILKNKRMKNGYLNLDVPESKIVLDNVTGKCIDVRKYETSFANEIIEQFMLTANETIAERFYWLDVPFIYRVHEEPDIDKVKELNKFLFNLGYKIHISQDTVHSSAFAKVLEEAKGKPEEKVISNLVLRTLKVAKYDSENLGHFGIAGKYYCHFTSPIRRYPDLFIHRIISEYFASNEKQKARFAKKAPKYAENSSEREKVATKAEREAESMKKAEFMEDKIGEEYDGIISSVTNFGIFVQLENTIEGLIRFQDLGDEYFIYNESNKTLTGEKSGKVYRIGDKIRIVVIKASKELREIDFMAL
ncbi:MAG: ribonuclease R [Clostridia bacterium]|jgi:ribonuclease R|nr:ribonuclease R [Clostridia bacterium]